MNILQAKQILSAYTMDKEIAAKDPDVKEAFEMMSQDKELEKWFLQEQSFDKAFAEKMESISPPDRLKENILSAYSASNKEDFKVDNHSTNSTSSPKWLWPLAIAACFVALASITLNIIKTRLDSSPIDALITDIVAYDAYGRFQKLEPSDWFEIEKILEKNNAPVLHSVPVKFQNVDIAGCLSFSHNDHRVSLICIKKDESKFFHLYVVDLENSNNFKAIPQPTYKIFNERPAATWTDNFHLNIMLVNDDEKDSLKQLL